MLTGPAVLHVATHGGWRAGFAGAATSGPVTSSPWPDPLRGHMDVGALPPPTQDLSDALDQAGLRRALVLAVTASQVVSLWSVADASTPALMRDYYAALQHGTGRAEALRQAKRHLLQQPGYAHPFYWAAFIPAGDWRPLDATAFLPQRTTP
jgi:CHAT domain-containing protein